MPGVRTRSTFARRMAERLMTETCGLKAPGAPTRDAGYGWLPGVGGTVTVKCRADAEAGEVQTDESGVRYVSRLTLYLPVTAAVDERYTVTWQGREYAVVSAPPPGNDDAERPVEIVYVKR